ncbi:MAG TPA: phosphodiester glycosidase family protein [Niastella sp.]
MKMIRVISILIFVLSILSFSVLNHAGNDNIISYIVDPEKQDLQLYWKNDKGQLIQNFENLKTYLANKNKQLVFAMNGGMFKPDYSPCGLYIHQQKTITPLVTGSGTGNFFLTPNGVFYINNKNVAAICTTPDFTNNNNQVKWATQSGPMLVIDGTIHPAFTKGSANVNIRNGVGILPDNKIVFAISKEEINFYDFAEYFKNLGCKNALYLDGFVSRMYLPEKNLRDTDGDFGVMIGVSAAK